MAELTPPKQGVLNINNVQGNYVVVPMQFSTDGTPINLVATYKQIRLEIKTSYNVNIKPFLVLELGDGLEVSGDNNNVLSFVLDDKFWESQTKHWVYDITFVDQTDRAFTLIKGNINNILTASSV
jgi:hypothetical protein